LSLYDEDTRRTVPFFLIGSDQGFLPRPLRLTSLLKANAERHDILVDFQGMEGHTITMMNNGPVPYPDGGGGPDIPKIMQFRVVEPLSGRSFSIPSTLAGTTSISALPNVPVALVRDIPLDEIEDDEMDEMRDPNFGPDPLPFEGDNETEAPVMALIELKHWSAPTSITPKAGTTEIWRFINATPDTHPIHVHLVEFEVLDRQQFNVDLFKATRTVDFTNPKNGRPYPVQPPDPSEQNAPKDVVRVEQNTVTRIRMTFNLPAGTISMPGQRFKYVVHCHILEHEDNEMMRPFEVVA
jgi:spore coat protein A